jgi:hypothetical protein
LLLFERGSCSFAWLDERTEADSSSMSRPVGKTPSPVLHFFLASRQLLDALVCSGASRADRAGQVAGLVGVCVEGTWSSDLPKVTDPALLPGGERVGLSGRSFDMEWAFRTLKEPLGVRLLWSGKLAVIDQHLWACLLLWQAGMGLQAEMAAPACVEPFEGSIERLVRDAAGLLERGVDLIEAVLTQGRALGIIRPSRRLVPQVPLVALWQYCWAPPELLQPQVPRWAHGKCHSRSPSS